MDKPHCDRCDIVIEPYPTWVEVAGLWADQGSPHVVHYNFINPHTHRQPPAFCRSCAVRILRQYCNELDPPVALPPEAPEVKAASEQRARRWLPAPPIRKVKKKKVRASITRGTR